MLINGIYTATPHQNKEEAAPCPPSTNDEEVVCNGGILQEKDCIMKILLLLMQETFTCKPHSNPTTSMPVDPAYNVQIPNVLVDSCQITIATTGIPVEWQPKMSPTLSFHITTQFGAHLALKHIDTKSVRNIGRHF